MCSETQAEAKPFNSKSWTLFRTFIIIDYYSIPKNPLIQYDKNNKS
jgi:hypothetical protein